MASTAETPKPAWAAIVKAVSGGGAGEAGAGNAVASAPQLNGEVGDAAGKAVVRPAGLTTAAAIVKGVAAASSAVTANTSAVEIGTPGQLAKEKGSKGSPDSDGKVVEGAAGDNAGTAVSEGAGGKERDSSEPKKPVWNVVREPQVEVPVPVAEGGQVWPTLADTKDPLPKKEQRKLAEQQAAAAAAANKDQASTSGADAGQKSKSQGKREKKGSKASQDGEGKGKGRSRRGKLGKSADLDSDGAGGQGVVQGGGKQKKGGQGKSRGMMHKGMPAMPYGIAPPMMYAPQTPVFYPPAAYGVASNVDMVMAAIRKQIDFYFSEENLVKDMYLRGKMDADGWVEMATIAAFNRVRMLTPDLSIIARSLEMSPIIEISPDGLFLRAKEGHQKWVLPEDKRDPNVRSPIDPAALAAQAEIHAAEGKKKKKSKAGDAAANAQGTSNTSQDDSDDVFQLDEEHDGSAQTKKPSTNKLSKLIVVKPSSTQKSALSAQLEASKSGNAATHADIHAGLEQYGHELRKPSGGPNANSSATNASNPRPMANGGRHKHANFYPSSVGHSFMANRHHGKGGRAHGGAVGWVLGSTPDAHSPRFMSPTNRRGSCLGSSAPIQKFQHPSYELLEENGFTEIKYEKFHDRCIQERTEKGVGLSEEMNTLFRFWCYFLRDHFEEVMYDDFKKYALDDSEQGYHYGIECLFRFFSYGLESHFDAKLYREFEEYVLLDHKGGHLYGLEKFWAYHHYHGLPKDCGFEMHPDLKKLLETEFKTIDDFKAKREANLHRSS